MADPGIVTFAKRNQELIARFSGDISDALSINDEGALVLNEELVEPEMLRLILSTLTAHSFNYMIPDCSTGTHEIAVFARVNLVESDSGYSMTLDGLDPAESVGIADAWIGKGSVAIECVRMVNDEVIDLQ